MRWSDRLSVYVSILPLIKWRVVITINNKLRNFCVLPNKFANKIWDKWQHKRPWIYISVLLWAQYALPLSLLVIHKIWPTIYAYLLYAISRMHLIHITKKNIYIISLYKLSKIPQQFTVAQNNSSRLLKNSFLAQMPSFKVTAIGSLLLIGLFLTQMNSASSAIPDWLEELLDTVEQFLGIVPGESS